MLLIPHFGARKHSSVSL